MNGKIFARKVMVYASKVSATKIPTDTLYLARIADARIAETVLVLGPRSAFPKLPPKAVALLDLDQSLVPARAKLHGDVYLNRKWDLPSDLVVVFGFKGKTAAPEARTVASSAFSVKSSLAGKLVLDSSTKTLTISETRELFPDLEVEIPTRKGDKCPDLIACICQVLGC
jgi:hypothetical protein